MMGKNELACALDAEVSLFVVTPSFSMYLGALSASVC